ncbi:MAG: sugar phosphate isomerase/epimerase [Ruminococcaceae bacterium]|nr:sugar phosphate isomerase/epimerase [Oscillospiraceae bacterium]
MDSKLCLYWPPHPGVKSYYDMIDASVAYGFSHLEGFSNLDFSTPDTENAKRIREYADSKGISFSCFSVYINLVGKDSSEMAERLRGYAEVAKILGSPYLHHTVVNDFTDPENVLPYRDGFFKKGIEEIRNIYDFADSLGVRTIYEEQGFLFNGIDGIGRLLDSVNRNVGIVADFANIYQAGENPEEFIKTFGEKVVHAHVKDIALLPERGKEGLKTLSQSFMHERKIGEGIVDIKGCIDLLKACGYNGFYGIEYTAKSFEEMKSIIDTLKTMN